MRLGANLWIWDGVIDEDVIGRGIETLVEIGADVIEIPYERIGAWDPVRVRAMLDDGPLVPTVCVAMSPERDLTTADSTTVRGTQEYIRSAIDTASEVGATIVGGPIYSPTGLAMPLDDSARRERLQRLADNLAPVLASASMAGVRLAIEPLNRFETSLFNTVEQLVPFVDEVSSPALGLLLATFHMNIEETDIPTAFRLAAHRITHVHACGNNRGAPRNGSIPWLAILQVLREVGYHGDVVIESFTADNETIAAAA